MDEATEEEARTYERDGFLVIPSFLSEGECFALMDRAKRLVDSFEVPSRDRASVFSTNEQTRTSDDYFLASGSRVSFFFEEEAWDQGTLRHDKSISINKIGHALHELDEVFAPFSKSTRLRDITRSVAGMKTPELVQSMYIFKNPLIGGDVSCHQDASFLITTPPSVVGLWFALEDATIENGCMWALPGGHRGPLRKRFSRAPEGDARGTVMTTLDETPLPAPMPSEPWIPLEAKRGTMIVLHGLLPHWSSSNRSTRSRHAYALHFVDGEAAWAADNWIAR